MRFIAVAVIMAFMMIVVVMTGQGISQSAILALYWLSCKLGINLDTLD
jgi:hypothetical protein